MIAAFDTETHLMRARSIAPPIVSVQIARGTTDEPAEILVESNAAPTFAALLDQLIEPGRPELLVGHNIAFDLGVLAADNPARLSRIYHALAGPPSDRYVWVRKGNGRVSDTLIREKLLCLATHGSLTSGVTMETDEDGYEEAVATGRLGFGLADLEKTYVGRDRTASKKDKDSVRFQFEALDGVPVDQWPQDHLVYAAQDAEGTYLCWRGQDGRARNMSEDPFKVENLQVAASFALFLMTAKGVEIDEGERQKLVALCEEARKPGKYVQLLNSGILRPAVAPKLRTFKNGREPEWTKGEGETRNMKELHARIVQICEAHGFEVKLTKTERVCADKEVLENLRGFDPVLEEYFQRQLLEKLVGTELPRMGTEGILHPCFNVLVMSGRTSSYATDDYPSGNCQNVDPRARSCYRARAGKVLLSIDFSSLEFCSMAQCCWELFGFSRMRELLLAGIDPHAYLGARLAWEFSDSFRAMAQSAGLEETDRQELLELFESLKGEKTLIEPAEIEEETDGTRRRRTWGDVFHTFRKMAKPVGFGFPGGLSAKTFISFAKKSYKVTVTHEQATRLREIWLETYPEMAMFFDWLNQQKDGGEKFSKKRGRVEETFTYVTPLGMRRNRAGYCDTANGKILQSAAAEGAKIAVFETSRACYDELYKCPELYGCAPLMFIHDEIIFEIPEDEWMHERAEAGKRIMVESMKQIMKDVPVKCKAVLMRNWVKDEEPTFVNGRLVVTERKVKEKIAA